MTLTFGLLPPNLPRKTLKNTQEKGLKDSNMLKVGKAICHKCKEPAKFHNGRWWCGHKSEMGTYNIVGYCKKERKDKSANSNS